MKTPSARAINKTMLIVELTRRRAALKQFMEHGATPTRTVACAAGFAGFFILRQFFDDACCGQ